MYVVVCFFCYLCTRRHKWGIGVLLQPGPEIVSV